MNMNYGKKFVVASSALAVLASAHLCFSDSDDFSKLEPIKSAVKKEGKTLARKVKKAFKDIGVDLPGMENYEAELASPPPPAAMQRPCTVAQQRAGVDSLQFPQGNIFQLQAGKTFLNFMNDT